MSITLTAEPEVIDGARSYAEHSGMTLEAFVLACDIEMEGWKTCQAH